MRQGGRHRRQRADHSARTAPARSWWRGRCTASPPAPAGLSSRSTWARSARTLFESELFGHVKGRSPMPARTAPDGSRWPRAGRFSSMRSATCRRRCRPSCCTALENRQVTRLGANKPIRCRCPADLRHQPADSTSWSSSNHFRQDLLYRINTVEIHLPPLRERPEDLPLLAGHFLEVTAANTRSRPKEHRDGGPGKAQAVPLARQYPRAATRPSGR